METRASRRLVIILVVVLAVLLVGVLVAGAFGASPASAHAVLVSSDPPSGAELATSPAQVRLRFSEDVAGKLVKARLVDGAGAVVPGTTTVTGDREVQLVLPSLPTGSYAVVWSVVAEDDGHETSGSVAFGVGTAPASVAAGSTSGDGGAPLRAARLMLTSAAFGCCALALLVLRGSAPAVRRRLLVWAAIGAGAAGVLTLADTGPAGSLTATRGGRLTLLEAGLLLVLVLVLLPLSGSLSPPRLGGPLVGALLLGVAVLETWHGHAAALSGPLPVIAGSAHALAALTWLGLLPALVVAVGPAADRALVLRAGGRRFARLAGASLVLVVATGLLRAGEELGRPSEVLATGYGHILLVKAGLVGCILALALGNDRLLRRGRPAVRLVAVEAAAGVAALVAAAVLSDAVPHPAGEAAQAAGASRSSSVTSSGAVRDLVVSVTASPGRPGLNVFGVLVTSTRRPAPAPLTSAALGLGGRVVALRPDGRTGHYLATVDVTGVAPLDVVLGRGDERVVVPVSWRSAAPVPPADEAVPTGAPLSAYTLPLAGLALLLGGSAVVWATRHHEVHP